MGEAAQQTRSMAKDQGQVLGAAQGSTDRPNADVIRAYAAGQDVQYKCVVAGKDLWQNYDEFSPSTLGNAAHDWRVKPAKVTHDLFIQAPVEGGLCVNMCTTGHTPNLRLTFELGELVAAKPLRPELEPKLKAGPN